MAKLFANSRDPDQMPHVVASNLGLHHLPMTLLGVSRLRKMLNVILNKKKIKHGSILTKYIKITIQILVCWESTLLLRKLSPNYGILKDVQRAITSDYHINIHNET